MWGLGFRNSGFGDLDSRSLGLGFRVYGGLGFRGLVLVVYVSGFQDLRIKILGLSSSLPRLVQVG